MTLFGLDASKIFAVFLEWITSARRHRKELEREYGRGWNDAIAEGMRKEKAHVQQASAADDNLAADDGVSGEKDPHNTWSGS